MIRTDLTGHRISVLFYDKHMTEIYWLIYAAAILMTLSCGVLFSVTELI